MQILRSILLALASGVAAYAQTDSATGPNAFTNTALSATAGEPVTLTWNATTPGTVSLILRNGASSNLNVGTPIAENIANSGSYTWTPSEDAVRGSDYTIEIVSDEDESLNNYSAYFVLESDNTVAATTASTVSAAPLPTTLTTASPTSESASSTETDSSTSASDNSASSTSTDSASSTSTSSATRTTASDLQATSSSSQAAGARATAMVGMLGAVALGAIAL